MIEFKTVRFKNFGSFGNYFTEIYLDKYPMVLVSGSNGQGKSFALLDSITFGLFGKPFRKVNIPQLVNSINQKHCVVEVEFSIGKDDYKVRRGLSPKIFEIYKNDVMIHQDAKAKDYQRMLEEQILKMNYKSFTQVVILGSSSFVPFMQLPAADRREVIEDILDIQIFSTMNTLMKSKYSEVKESIGIIDQKIEVIVEKVSVHKKMIETLQKQNEDNLEVIMNDIKNTEDNIKELESKIESLQAEVDSLLLGLTEQDETKKTFKELTKKLNQTEQMLNRLEKEMKFYTENDNCSTCRQPIADDHKDKICSLIAEEQDEKNKIRVEHETSIDAVEKKLDEYTETLGRVREKEKEISNHNTTIRANQSYITKNQKEYSRLMSIDKENLKEKDILKNLAKEGKEQVEKQQELKEEKVLAEYAMALLKDSGIKSKIIRHYLPTMNKLINKYLTVMDFFAQFNLDENFNETIKSRHRDDFSYMSFSEGEKLRIDLAILLTWREIARLKNSANTNLLILDEVFDSSLDSGGTDEFMKLLHNLGSRCNVYIISHKADQLADKFNNMMVFDKKNNFSKLKIV